MLIPLFGLLFFFHQITAGPQQAKTKAAGDLYRAAAPSVVLIETYGPDGKVSSTGTGFIVSASGAILTNFHVIAHTKRATVRLANEDAYDTVEILDVDKRKDIALIKIKAVSLPYLTLGRSGSVQIGDKLFAVGNPLGMLQNTLSEGILSGIRQADGYKLFQLSTPISHGSSGSPVFNTSGEVVAIIALTAEEGQNLNFAIPIDYAAGMLDSKQTRPLESVYEPEETSSKVEASASAESKTPAPAKPTTTPTPSESIKADALTYLSSKIGIWTKEDAEVELGPPVDRRDGLTNNAVTADIYKYTIPFSGFGTIELDFVRNTKRLGAAYFYYRTLVSWTQVRNMLGRNYKKQKLPNGRPGYLYQFQQRQLFVIVDSAENVVSLGIW